MGSSSDRSELSEGLLVVLVRNHDWDAFDVLVRRYESRLAYYVRRLIGRDAETEDILQEVWLVVYRRLGTLQSPAAFRVWLFKIAHDVAVSHLRRVLRTPKTASIALETPDIIDAWDEFEAMANAELVHRTIESLSAEHREVLTLRFLEQMELAEIAEITGCSLGTAKSRLHYAKAALRKQIEGENDG